MLVFRASWGLGVRLLLPLPLPARPSASFQRAGMLFISIILLKALLDWLTLLGLPASFNPYGFMDISTQLLLLLGYVWALSLRNDHAAGLECLTLAASAWPLLLVLDSLGNALLLHTSLSADSDAYLYLSLTGPVLVPLLVLRAWLATHPTRTLTQLGSALLLALILGATRLLLPSETFWNAELTEDPNAAAYEQLDLETLWAEQPALLESQFSTLAAPDPEQADSYFLGFAAYPYQSVFKREVERAQAVFSQDYGTAQRNLLLVNHLDTHETLPLATVANLNLALSQFGQGFDVSNDVLVLYLSSHGIEAGGLAVEFGNLPLNALTPEQLKASLDAAGIRWRIIIVSACYSGQFLTALADAHSLIITAARADRASFGCDDTTTYTYFGQSLLDALARTGDFSLAFAQAQAEIAQREQRDFPRQPQSEPQFALGQALAARLPELQARWRKLRPQPATTVHPAVVAQADH